MELDAEGRPTVREAADHLSCLGVPQVYQFVEACTQELASVISEADVTDSLGVPLVRSDALPVGRCIPDLARAIVAG